MEYGIPPANPQSTGRLSSYFDACVQDTQTMHGPSIWLSKLNSLHGQKGYLEELLSKTATTLNALRDRQTRNERALSTLPIPRSKRKKIQQNRWKTGKTIQTCENEERVILDCLQVCTRNIHTLEAIIHQRETPHVTAKYYSSNSYADSDANSFDWHGWTDDAPISPFKKERRCSLLMDEIAPEASFDGIVSGRSTARRSPLLRPQSNHAPASTFFSAPLNTAYTRYSRSTLSPEAAEFEPSVKHNPLVRQSIREMDKLSISGLLASKRMQSIQKRSCSDVAINHSVRGTELGGPTPASTARVWSITGKGQREKDQLSLIEHKQVAMKP
ncbi:hypothetical protein N0V90_003785 [Kalmusia sp. IMI 367209]|nr:hypothetical protein N0V90_003785 [Kalmusia sp. IMI 367209]